MKYQILEMMFEGEKPKSVLEIGCANGGLLADIDETFHFEKMGGLDISGPMLKESQDRFPNHAENFILHDINNPFPIPDNSYDIVFSCGVLLYIVNPIPVVREMLRICKDKIIIAEPHWEDADDVGQIGRVDMTMDKTHHAIFRNYKKFFNMFRIFPYTFRESGLGKAIIKCPKSK